MFNIRHAPCVTDWVGHTVTDCMVTGRPCSISAAEDVFAVRHQWLSAHTVRQSVRTIRLVMQDRVYPSHLHHEPECVIGNARLGVVGLAVSQMPMLGEAIRPAQELLCMNRWHRHVIALYVHACLAIERMGEFRLDLCVRHLGNTWPSAFVYFVNRHPTCLS